MTFDLSHSPIENLTTRKIVYNPRGSSATFRQATKTGLKFADLHFDFSLALKTCQLQQVAAVSGGVTASRGAIHLSSHFSSDRNPHPCPFSLASWEKGAEGGLRDIAFI